MIKKEMKDIVKAVKKQRREWQGLRTRLVIAVKALEAIKNHQQVVMHGSMAMSTTWTIADRALKQIRGGGNEKSI